MNSRKCLRAWLPAIGLALFVVMSVGCAVTSPNAQRMVSTAGPGQQDLSSIGRVQIGGEITQPLMLDIPSTGLTLSQALVQVIETPLDAQSLEHLRTVVGDEPPDLEEYELALNWHRNRMVVLQRNVIGIQHFRYFALADAQQDVVGQISLQSGDILRIIPMADSGLRDPADHPTKPTFSITGMVDQPVSLEINAMRYSNLKDVITNAPKAYATAGNPTHLILVRNASSGLSIRHYLADLRAPWLRAVWDDIPLHAGDQIVFTRLAEMPVIRSALVEAIQRERQTKAVADRARGQLVSAASERMQSIAAFDTARQLGQTLWSRLSRLR